MIIIKDLYAKILIVGLIACGATISAPALELRPWHWSGKTQISAALAATAALVTWYCLNKKATKPVSRLLAPLEKRNGENKEKVDGEIDTSKKDQHITPTQESAAVLPALIQEGGNAVINQLREEHGVWRTKPTRNWLASLIQAWFSTN